MAIVRLNEVPWIVAAVERLTLWLIKDCAGSTWTEANMRSPHIYRWTVAFITYEGLFQNLWTEPWFQDGMRAFGLLALELEEKIIVERLTTDGLCVHCDGRVYSMIEFLNGESLEIRFNPDYSDLCWDPVDAIGHILSEYAPD